jgi:dihydrofolate reductase
MRKIIVSEFMTLDGVMQAPGGKDEDTDGGFEHGGWTWSHWDDAIGAHLFAMIGEADTLLLGRKTWQTHGEAFEPMADDDPNEPGFNAKKKYVVSTTLTNADAWRNSTIISDNVIENVRDLKAQPGKNILIDGSSVLIHDLARHGLIDEYNLLIFPLALGSGKKVFPDGERLNLRLIESRTFPSGVVLARYTVENAHTQPQP